MEDVLGGRTDPARFAAFLADWEAILRQRVEEATATFRTVDGLRGLVLAGGVGRAEPWPLSDIDLLPIYDDSSAAIAAAEIERRRPVLLRRWVDEGWWTGLDVGRLYFTQSEVERVLGANDVGVLDLLHDDRWYYSIDKGFGGRAVLDADGTAAGLARWLTAQRFSPAVVSFRLDRARDEVRAAVKWQQTWHLERWGHRDNSLGRFGTRFEELATARGAGHLVDAFDALGDLDDVSVWRRLEAAPDWVWERHDRSWRSRRHVGESVSRLQDARDTLRVCSLYAIRTVTEPPYPAWLSILEPHRLAARTADLRDAIAY